VKSILSFCDSMETLQCRQISRRFLESAVGPIVWHENKRLLLAPSPDGSIAYRKAFRQNAIRWAQEKLYATFIVIDSVFRLVQNIDNPAQSKALLLQSCPISPPDWPHTVAEPTRAASDEDKEMQTKKIGPTPPVPDIPMGCPESDNENNLTSLLGPHYALSSQVSRLGPSGYRAIRHNFHGNRQSPYRSGYSY